MLNCVGVISPSPTELNFSDSLSGSSAASRGGIAEKHFDTLKERLTWLDLLWTLLAMALISFTYLALPSRYHMKPDWQEAAACVMIASVFIVVASRSVFWRKPAFWMSWVISSAIHLVVVRPLDTTSSRS
jgi:hypothetical protein